jgi:major membrane immunogen (membrane-anchored lipoprotein)
MKKKLMFIFAIVLLVLTGCGKDQTEETMALKNHSGKEVAFPQDKPSVFFFITTYT